MIRAYKLSFLLSLFVCFIQAQSSNLTSLYPNSRGWINKYADLYAKGYIQLKENLQIPTTNEKTLALERVLLPEAYPTLLYATQISDQHWTKKDKSKLLLFEYFLNVYIQSKGLPMNDLGGFVNSLCHFYQVDTIKWNNNISKMHFLEHKIASKLKIHGNLFHTPLWYRIETNAMILNEVSQYQTYLLQGKEFSKFVKDSLANASISFVVQEARKDYIINCKEKELFAFYLASADFTLKANRFWIKTFENDDTTHFTNGSIKEGQQVVKNYNACQDNFSIWKHEARFKWSRILKRNGYKFSLEGRETVEMFSLLKKSFKVKLNDDERQKIKHQSVDLLMAIPSCVIFILPGGEFVLPVILKYVPVFCPSAFRDNSLNVK